MTGSSALQRTAVAAVVAGAAIFAGQAGELVFGSPSDTFDAVLIALLGVGFVALGVALWGLREVTADSRSGRIGVMMSLAGVVLLGLFAVQAAIEVARSGEVPENFALFGLGFLLLVVGHLVFARSLRAQLGRLWLLPLVAAAGAVVALAVEPDPYHDIGLFVFEASWVALGVGLARQARARGPLTEASAA